MGSRPGVLVGLLRNDPSDIWTYNVMALSFDRFGLADLGMEVTQRGLELVEATGDPEKLHDQLVKSVGGMRQSESRGREAKVAPTVLAGLRAALALGFDAGQRRPVTKLCWELVPDLDQVPVKRPMKPSDLPLSEISTQPPKESPPAHKPGRNAPCWCGSGKKYKHCYMRSDRRRRK